MRTTGTTINDPFLEEGDQGAGLIAVGVGQSCVGCTLATYTKEGLAVSPDSVLVVHTGNSTLSRSIALNCGCSAQTIGVPLRIFRMRSVAIAGAVVLGSLTRLEDSFPSTIDLPFRLLSY